MSAFPFPQRVVMLLALTLGSAWGVEADELGSITFPNSGSAEAQQAFLTGVKALHSFQFDEARFAFEDAQEIDPDFALAYWGQAMSDNHPLWAQQDEPAATAALQRLAPTFEGRLAKAPTEKEKAFLTAVEILYYSANDKLTRDTNYAKHMGDMHARWPDDDEIAIFYALSQLGMVRRGDRGYRRQAKAASIALQVFERNPKHPGAAHFIIHAFDDPDHAILALPAAQVYAGIAPASAHALHMPSHIFLQLGMWDDVVNSNVVAYEAAVQTNRKYGLPEGREDFHTLSWLAYGNLMLGHYERAAENVSQAREAVDRNPGAKRIYNGYLLMRARHIIETGQWEAIDYGAADSMDGGNPHWVATAGMSAAHLDMPAKAMDAQTRLEELRASAEARGNDYNARLISVLERQLTALRLLKAGDKDGAIEHAATAAEMEVEYLRVPSGPPMPITPASELYANILLETGDPSGAISAYRAALDWVPNRTPSMLGLARAATEAGDLETAQATYTRLCEMPGANPQGPVMRAAESAACRDAVSSTSGGG
ncbi:MAG: tetratricopeptide repeat protein [Pseudomonadota bacterium]